MDAYLKFDIPIAPTGMKLTKATLKYWVASSASSASKGSHTISLAGNSWTETSVTYKSRPAITTTKVGTITGATKADSAGEASLTVGSLKVGATTLAIETTGSDDLRIWSKEFTGKGRTPVLELTYTQA